DLDRAHKLRRHRSAGEARRQGGGRPGRDRGDQGRRPGPDAHHAVAQAGERLPADRVGPRRARGDWRGQAPGRIRARARVRVPLHQPAVEEVRAPDRHRSAEPGVDLVGGVEGPRGGGGRELRRWILLLCSAAACGTKGGSTPECAGNFLAGDLVISEVMPNPTGDDTGKEWFEVYNADTRAVDLAGLELVVSLPDRTMEKAVAVTAGTIPAGGYFVFSSSAPDLVPGYADYGYGTGLGSLRNDTARLALRCNGIVVDEVTYANVTEGASREFTGAQPPDTVANDDPAKWCNGVAEYETGNKGTPGAAND